MSNILLIFVNELHKHFSTELEMGELMVLHQTFFYSVYKVGNLCVKRNLVLKAFNKLNINGNENISS